MLLRMDSGAPSGARFEPLDPAKVSRYVVLTARIKCSQMLRVSAQGRGESVIVDIASEYYI